jgi:peroxiredoxin
VSSSRRVKRFVIIVLLVLVAAAGYRFYGSPETGTGTLTLPQPAPNIDDDAPSFQAESRDGRPFELSDSGVYVVTFWSASSLPFLANKDTAEAQPEFEQMARDYENDGVSFAAVYVSYAPESEAGLPYAVLQDPSGELTGLYNVKRVPRLFLISDGKIELVQNGHYLESDEQLREGLNRVL